MLSLAGTSFKNLFSKPATKMYPVKPMQPFDATRGVVEVDIETCILCGLCAKNCPADAITVDKKETRTWSIDPYLCIRCGECVSRCNKNSLSMDSFDKCVAVEKEIRTVVKPEEEAAPAAEAPAEA